MRLDDQASSLKARFMAEADAEITERIGNGLDELAAVHPAGKALGVGDRAPDFERRSLRDEPVRLSSRLRQGPVVLSFYRGGWCPFCNLELQAWQAQIEDLRRAGGQLIAIAPEAADHARSTAAEHGLEFTVLTDADQAVAESYGLVFELPQATREAQRMLGAPLYRLNADGSWRLPVPATFIIGTDRVIRWAHAVDDYTQRAEPPEVIEVVRALDSHGEQ